MEFSVAACRDSMLAHLTAQLFPPELAMPARPLKTHLCQLALVLSLVCVLGAARGDDEAAAKLDPATAARVEASLAELDDEKFDVRSQAEDSLRTLLARPELQPLLARRFSEVLLSAQTSAEVRARVECLAKDLPGGIPADGPAAIAEIAPLLDQLDADSLANREVAQRRLATMLKKPELVGHVYLELKKRLADTQLARQARSFLEPLVDQAREAWLQSDPKLVVLPPVSEQQVNVWLDELVRLDEAVLAERLRRAAAYREIMDVMAREDAQPIVLRLIAQKITSGDAGATQLADIAEYARPALAAEVWEHEDGDWEHRKHRTVQYLLVNVPQYNDTLMGRRATHFDRIDDKTAHCVSGASLVEGDYPVRVAIPHPDGTEVMFHLTNLSTTRRRLLYEIEVKRDESTRLAAITRRTFDDFAARQGDLDENHVFVLAQLDPTTVSQQVGKFFQNVPNQKLDGDISRQRTVHAGMCYALTRIGTHEAVPALERLARAAKPDNLEQSSLTHMAWIAALMIAQRDPWSDTDNWLAGLIDEKQPLSNSELPPPELGACAAALLLDRHGVSLGSFGLESPGDMVIGRLRMTRYRFASAKDRQRVKDWWDTQKGTADRRAMP